MINMNNEISTSFQVSPREEAGVLDFEKLTKGQKDAAEGVISLTSALAKEEYTDASGDQQGMERAYAKIEPRRLNHVVMIDGGRGSGKTALFLSLLQAWKAKLNQETEMPNGWGEKLESSGYIVPLSIIDLGSLQPSASLILHVALSLRRVVDAMISPAEREDHAVPWAPHEGEQLESQKHWGQFLTAAAIGWDGNLMERRAELDSESFVAEFAMSEHDRRDVVPTFQRFASSLFQDYRKRIPRRNDHDGEPLFVIPIDDADMNPHRSVELLELIGILRHPRVVFLITGDSDLFIAELKTYFAGAVRAPSRDYKPTLEELVRLGAYDQVPGLARRFYDKIVPPRHCCKLPPLSGKERRVQLIQAAKSGGEDPFILGVIEHLNKLFDRQHRVQLALPDRVRAILDLGAWLQRPREENDKVQQDVRINVSVAEFVERVWHDAIVEEPMLTSDESEHMYRCVRLPDDEQPLPAMESEAKAGSPG